MTFRVQVYTADGQRSWTGDVDEVMVDNQTVDYDPSVESGGVKLIVPTGFRGFIVTGEKHARA